MTTRDPFRAGTFYPASPDACKKQAESIIHSVALPTDLPSNIVGGLVPHAGWAFSGPLAAKTIKALCSDSVPDTFVIFGADHVGSASQGELYGNGAWQSPIGKAVIDEKLASEILESSELIRSNPNAHAMEHSIEVQVPLIQLAAPQARIVPLTIPPTPIAAEIGAAVGNSLKQIVQENGNKIAILGSTDLTHHAGHFPAPGGHGTTGEKWSRDNDNRMIKLIEAMDDTAIVREASEHMNACGAGAIAATIAACKTLGASRGICLEYTNSYQIIHDAQPDAMDDTTVGYASIIFA